MFFPEELDNKPFRVFVQRTLHLVKNNLALSNVEKELAYLIEQHPDTGIELGRTVLDAQRYYGAREYNPFVILFTLWQVHNQLKDDNPPGIRALADKYFSPEISDRQKRAYLAVIYFDLFIEEKTLQKEYSPRLYLAGVEERLRNPLYFKELEDSLMDGDEEEFDDEEFADEDDDEFMTPDMFDLAFDSYLQLLHDNVSSQPININSKIKPVLTMLPVEWIDATALFWKRPPQRLKRDRITDLISFLLSPKSILAIAAKLEPQEKQVLKKILDNDGYVKYSQISRTWGDESDDGYYWTEHRPKSVIGRLRLKGLVGVGKAPVKSRNYKMIIIPTDLRANVEKMVG
jgi:hypothetical protein